MSLMQRGHASTLQFATRLVRVPRGSFWDELCASPRTPCVTTVPSLVVQQDVQFPKCLVGLYSSFCRLRFSFLPAFETPTRAVMQSMMYLLKLDRHS